VLETRVRRSDTVARPDHRGRTCRTAPGLFYRVTIAKLKGGCEEIRKAEFSKNAQLP